MKQGFNADHLPPFHFVKMHGLGNDFVLINAIHQPFLPPQEIIAFLANRYTGIGFDQLLIIELSKQADFFCRIFNADGSEALQCGNGLRCVARFLHEEKLIEHRTFQLETKAGIFPLVIHDYERIQVTMGSPLIQEKQVQLSLSQGMAISMTIISVGNLHAIIHVDSIDTVLLDQLGEEIATHGFFTEGANVGFMQVVDPHHIRLRTFERGVGETHACGSNACAAVVAGMTQGWLQHNVRVEFRYGSLWIEWKNNQSIQMIGPASRVFSGKIA